VDPRGLAREIEAITQPWNPSGVGLARNTDSQAELPSWRCLPGIRGAVPIARALTAAEKVPNAAASCSRRSHTWEAQGECPVAGRALQTRRLYRRQQLAQQT
jgi:hypothetical protein